MQLSKCSVFMFGQSSFAASVITCPSPLQTRRGSELIPHVITPTTPNPSVTRTAHLTAIPTRPASHTSLLTSSCALSLFAPCNLLPVDPRCTVRHLDWTFLNRTIKQNYKLQKKYLERKGHMGSACNGAASVVTGRGPCGAVVETA